MQSNKWVDIETRLNECKQRNPLYILANSIRNSYPQGMALLTTLYYVHLVLSIAIQTVVGRELIVILCL